VSQRSLSDVRAGIERLTSAAEILCGGTRPVHPKGWFVAPTLLRARDPEADVLHGFEVFGPVATAIPYSGTAEEAIRLVNRGGGSLVASVYTNERAFAEDVVLGIGPWHGRVWIGSDRTADQALAPGMVLPATVHGGPGRAGGGSELGGLRGLAPYLQRVAVQGFQGWVAGFGPPGAGAGA
jgi:oxepin-CoA hydrolase/3-oxo-5,6-dehydrosuberyl-CoA semialdehyde dehydrogenase